MVLVDKFNKKRSEGVQTSIISEDTVVKGDIDVSASIFVYGKVYGNIISSGIVTVSGDGFVKGKIIADTLVVSGLCEGIVDARVVDIANKGVVDGEVFCEQLIIEEGGFLQGISKRKKKEEQEKELKIIENKKDNTTTKVDKKKTQKDK